MAATTLRKGLIALLAVAVAVTFIGGMVVLVLNTGGTEEAAAPTVAPPVEPPATTAPPDAVEPADTGVERDEGVYPHEEPYPEPEYVPLPPMGIRTTDFIWTVTELAASTGGETYIDQLVEVDGTLWAIGGGYDEAADRGRSFVFRSTDGVTWEQLELPAAIAGDVRFTATDAGLVAVASAWEDMGRPQVKVFVSGDGTSWTETDLTGRFGQDDSAWINQVAGSDGVIVLTGAIEPMPAGGYQPPVILIEKDGYLIEIDDGTFSYLITDAASGEVVAHGSLQTIYEHEGEHGIYDGDTGEIIFAIGWEALDRAGVTAYEAVAWGERIVISVTSGERTLTLDEFTDELVVTDASGDVLSTGTREDLFGGPPPTFRDRDGNVIVVVPWDEWSAAYEAAYPPDDGEEAWQPTPIMLRSDDGGATWQQVDIAAVAPAGFWFHYLAGGPDGFLAVGVIEEFRGDPPYGAEPYEPPAPIVLVSADGLAWSEVPANLEPASWVSGVTVTAAGYRAVLGGAEGSSEVIASADGATWETLLGDEDLRLEIGQVWFQGTADGGLGTFAYGGYDAWVEPEVIATQISRDGRTLTIEGPIYTVTDDVTGAVLFTFDESEYWHHEGIGGVPESGFKWGQGGIAMYDDAGGVIFAASHRQFEEAMRAVWSDPGVYYESEQVLLYRDGREWARVLLPEDLGPHPWISGVVVTETSVVVTVTAESHGAHDYSVRALALVGVPTG